MKMALVRRKGVIGGFQEEKLYVAVSREVKGCKAILLWALQNSGGRRLCLIHVHQQSQTIPILGGRFPLSSLSEQQVKAHREMERKEMCMILDEYLCFCSKAGVQAETLYIEMDSIEKGIVELISLHKIERLVMGAAADTRYSRKMMEPKSKKANYVRHYAPVFCHTWFVCKGRLIHTRQATEHSHPNDPNEKEVELTNSNARLIQCTSKWSTPHSSEETEESFDDFDATSTFSLSMSSRFSLSSSAVTDSPLDPFPITGEREPLSQPEETQSHYLAKTVENLYYKELRRRIEIEEELCKAKEELKSTKKERDVALEELRAAMDQKLLLERRIEETDAMGKELGGRIMFALEFVQNNVKL